MNSHDYLGAVLINSLWQAPLIALTSWLLLRVLVRASAATRYAVWLTSLSACVLFPVLTTSPDTSLRVPAIVLRGVELAWIVGAAILLLRVGAAALFLSRLKRLAYPLDLNRREGLARWNARVETYRDVRLGVSNEVDTPVAIGLFDALILLPEWLTTSVSAAELDRLAMHELAHLRRYDDWTKLLQNIIEAMLFFNPAVRWISAQLEVEREVACDDAAVQTDSDLTVYASCLTRMARAVSWSSRFSLAPSLFAARRTLSLRIERLLQPKLVPATLSLRAESGFIALLAIAFFAVRSLTPIATQAFTLPQDDRAIHMQAVALYADLRLGRYAGTDFKRAESLLAQLGPVTDFRINCILGDAEHPAYLYDVRMRYGTATLRVRFNPQLKLTAFTLNASGMLSHNRMVRAFMTTEPRSTTS